MKPGKMKAARRTRRKKHIRKRVIGTAERPRLTVFRSCQHLYAQIIDDSRGVTLCEASTLSKGLLAKASAPNVAVAKVVGTELVGRAKAKGVTQVCFDRNGYKYHGVVKALGDAVREGGVAF